MAKKKQTQKKTTAEEKVEVVQAESIVADAAEEDEEPEEYEEDELELLQVDLGDMVKLKQILDESVASKILEKLEEEYRLDNFKLGIMVAACMFAMVAQFSPVPFPDSRPLLGLCCCVYFFLSGILQLITTFIDKDSILLTKALSGKCDTNPDMEKYGVRVRSQLPRFSEWYTVILEFQNRDDTPLVEQRWSVGQFFDKEGMFDEIGLTMEIEALYNRLESGKYDSPPTIDAEKKNK
jgi:signal peptidase complex subunit 2